VALYFLTALKIRNNIINMLLEHLIEIRFLCYKFHLNVKNIGLRIENIIFNEFLKIDKIIIIIQRNQSKIVSKCGAENDRCTIY
jgi:hypothetical protein